MWDDLLQGKKSGCIFRYTHFYSYEKFRLVASHHITFHKQTDNFLLGVCADGDGLSEMARELTFAIVSDYNLAAFAWLDGFFRILWHGASTRCNGLMNHKKLVSRIRKLECASLLGIRFGEGSEIVGGLVEFDFSTFGLCSKHSPAENHQYG